MFRPPQLKPSSYNILTDQYNDFVTLKDFELPDDGFN